VERAYSPPGSFGAWANTVISHETISKKRIRHEGNGVPFVPGDPDVITRITEEQSQHFMGAEAAGSVDVIALINNESFSRKALTSFILLHYYGFRISEISLMLGMPEGTVKSSVHHAKAELRSHIETAVEV
jgi:DNA-directed RNA polymerase specialized sigma24 family protein